jgi:isoleucyl-tRNA synthetase
MSKSLGNTVDPQDVCKKYGADILRLWTASTEYTADVRIGEQILNQNAEAYRKIRNTFRFLLGNLSDYNNDTDRVPYEKMSEVDQYMECSLNQFLENAYKAFDSYAFDEVYRLTLNYLSNTLSAFYLDFTKDVLYIESKDDIARRSIQTVFYDNLDALVRLLTPFIPYTTEEVYSFMENISDKQESVYLLNMVEVKHFENEKELLDKYQKFMGFRTNVLKAIEEARNNKVIGKSLSAKLVIKPTEETKQLLESIKSDLKTIFIVSELVITDENIEGLEFDSATIQVTAKQGTICKRCWQVVDVANEDGICERCAKVVENL